MVHGIHPRCYPAPMKHLATAGLRFSCGPHAARRSGLGHAGSGRAPEVLSLGVGDGAAQHSRSPLMVTVLTTPARTPSSSSFTSSWIRVTGFSFKARLLGQGALFVVAAPFAVPLMWTYTAGATAVTW